MFENNTDFDFDDNLPNCVNFKRPLELKSPTPNKKPKSLENLPKNIVKRKFPGPAGILPERKDLDLTITEPRSEEIPCSQSTLSIFQSDPWLEMLRNHRDSVDRYNIKWIKSKAVGNQLPNQKAPFLGAIVQNIECFDGKIPIINVILKDLTGEIQGTIMHNLYEEYSGDLVTGAVIVLKQFGVLTTGSNNNYLTITPNNLVTIYTKDKSDQGGGVKIVKIQSVSSEESKKPLQIQNIFESEEDFAFPDDLDEKKESVSRISVNASEEHSEIWQNALEGLDADSFFEDF